MAKIIAVTGKGGTGKTMVSALMIRYLKRNAAGPILALDADPDANLGTVLGSPVPQTIGDLREETLKAMKNFPAGMSKESYIEAGLHGVIVETDKVDLITMGRSEGPGCYCYINNLLRKFADDLQGSYDWVVMDNEAGLEHISRRTASRVDHLIVVVNVNPLSMDCARRIDALTSDLKNEIRNRHILLNAVGADKEAELTRKAESMNMKVIGNVPYDPAVDEFVIGGRSLYELDETPAVRTIGEIMKRLK